MSLNARQYKKNSSSDNSHLLRQNHMQQIYLQRMYLCRWYETMARQELDLSKNIIHHISHNYSIAFYHIAGKDQKPMPLLWLSVTSWPFKLFNAQSPSRESKRCAIFNAFNYFSSWMDTWSHLIFDQKLKTPKLHIPTSPFSFQ